MGKMVVTAEQFVQEVLNAAKNGQTWDDVSAKLGIKKNSCTVKASNLRKEGVNLPTLPRSGSGGRKRNIAALAKMVSDFQAAEAVVESVTEQVAEVAVTTEVSEQVTEVTESQEVQV